MTDRTDSRDQRARRGRRSRERAWACVVAGVGIGVAMRPHYVDNLVHQDYLLTRATAR